MGPLTGHNGGCSRAALNECPLLGVKQTSHGRVAMSANNPKRTCDEPISRLSRKIVGSQYHGSIGLGLLFEELT